MNSLSTSAVMLLIEGVVLFGGTILVYLFLTARRCRRERELVRRVVKKFRQEEGGRRDALQEVLRDGCGHEDEAVTAISDDFSDREKALYNSVMRMYLGKDRQAISNLDDKVQSIVRGYQKLVMNEAPGGEDSELGAGQLPYTQLRKENESLKSELETLRKELFDAKLTAENIMKEYATMYAGGEREGELQVREELKKLRGRDWTGNDADDAAAGTAALDESVLEGDGDTDVDEFSAASDSNGPATS